MTMAMADTSWILTSVLSKRSNMECTDSKPSKYHSQNYLCLADYSDSHILEYWLSCPSACLQSCQILAHPSPSKMNRTWHLIWAHVFHTRTGNKIFCLPLTAMFPYPLAIVTAADTRTRTLISNVAALYWLHSLWDVRSILMIDCFFIMLVAMTMTMAVCDD